MILIEGFTLHAKCSFDDTAFLFFLLGVFNWTSFLHINIQIFLEILFRHILGCLQEIKFGWCTQGLFVVVHLNIWVIEFDGIVSIHSLCSNSFHIVYSRLNDVDFQATDGLSFLISFSHI